MPYSFRNRYLLTEQVECNAVAAVFRARSTGAMHGPELTVKVARGDGTPESVAVAKKAFRNEGAVAETLNEVSSAFLGFRERGSDEPAYLALEHVSWPTLDALAAQASAAGSHPSRRPPSEKGSTGALPPPDIARIGVALLRAVGCMEELQIVHGHLIPKNIHVRPRDDHEYDVKIAGAGADPPKPDDPAVGPRCAHAYMSPEQWAGEPLTTASDVHTVASVLWELATGQVPWSLSDEPLSKAKRLAQMRKAPQRPEDMPEELYAILAKALSFDAAGRASGPARGEDGEFLLATRIERGLQRFLSESSRQHVHARRKLQELAPATAALRERLEPFSGLLRRTEELAAAVQRLGNEEGASKATSAEVDALQGKLQELLREVDARTAGADSSGADSDRGERISGPRRSAMEDEDDEPASTPSDRSPKAESRGSWLYVVPAVGAIIVGFFIGLGVGRAGTDTPASGGQPSATSVQLSPSGAAPARSVATSTATAASSAAPSASATATESAAPTAAPTTTESAAPTATATAPGTPPTPSVRLTGKLPDPDPYGEAKPRPVPPPKPRADDGDVY